MTGGEREDSLLVTGTWKARTRVGGTVILKKKKKKQSWRMKEING